MTEPVLHVCFVTWRDLAHPSAGGSEVLVDHLLRGLQQRGHTVALVCGGPVGARPYPVSCAGGTYSQYLLAPLTVMRRHRRFDLVVDVENGVPFFAPLWRRRPVMCLVHHVHGPQWRMRFPALFAAVGWFLERRMMPWAYRRSLFLAVSPSTASALEHLGVAQDRIRTFAQGIEVRECATPRRPQGEPVFVAIGRLVPHKGVERLLRAWSAVHAEIGGTFVIVGDGPQLDALRAAAPDGVEVRGRVEEAEKWSLLERCWFLVHGAHHEGWGIAVMEAAATGRPTVAFDVAGVRDSVVHGVTGVLVADGDDRELATQWLALARDPDRCQALGAAALERARLHAWDDAIDRFVEVAHEAMR